MKDALVRLLGWRAMLLHGDPTVVDRWRWLRRHLRPGRLRTLDAGCGSGVFTLYAARRGNEALGLSFGARDLAKARRRAELLGLPAASFRDGDLRRLDEYADALGTFDQIILFETIEHIRDDERVVAGLAALLNPGGTLLLTVPYEGHRPLWRERVSEQEDGGHVRWGYTPEQLRAMLRRCGLEVAAEAFLSGVVSQKIASLQFGLVPVHRMLAWAAGFPLRIFHPLDGPLTRLTRYPHLSVGVVARKPAAAAGPAPTDEVGRAEPAAVGPR